MMKFKTFLYWGERMSHVDYYSDENGIRAQFFRGNERVLDLRLSIEDAETFIHDIASHIRNAKQKRGDYMQDKPSLARKYRDMIAERPEDSERIERILGKIFKDLGQIYRYRKSNTFDVSFPDGSTLEIRLRDDGSCSGTLLKDNELKQQLKDIRGE